jgi:hypothetical protein
MELAQGEETADMKIDLSGKTAVVTGSTAGIGRAIARGLGLHGTFQPTTQMDASSAMASPQLE